MQKKSNKLGVLFVAAVYFSMSAASVYSSWLQKMQIYELTAHLCISVILSIALVQYMKRTQLKQQREIPDKPLFVLLFMGANLLMAAVKAEDYGFLWLLPMIMLAISAGIEYAMVVYVVLLAQNILIHVNAISAWELVTTVIYGAFCIWLMQQKLTVRVLPYLFISMLSVDGILQILRRQFQLVLLKKESRQMIIELISVIVLEVFIFCYVKYREKKDRLSADAAGESILPDDEFGDDEFEEDEFGDDESEEGSFGDGSEDEDEFYEEEGSSGEEFDEDEEELEEDEDESYRDDFEEDEDESSLEEDEESEEEEELEEEEIEEEETEEEELEEEEIEEETEEEELEEEEIEEETEEEELEEEEPEEASEEEPSGEDNIPEQEEKDLSDILAEDYPLRLRLQEHSEQLYRHSLRISNIAAEAADYMEGNVLLAQAGGLYHEIGRIVDEKNYINEGERLLREEGWSEDLIAVVRQHTASEKPQSLEAAIVLLADYIISTSDYLEKAGRRKELSDEQLVNTIFRNRLDKGNLDEAGMSDGQLEALREFYAEEIFNI